VRNLKGPQPEPREGFLKFVSHFFTTFGNFAGF